MLQNVGFYLFYPQTSDLGVTECIEGDDCKFAVWTGRSPVSDYRIVIKVSYDKIISLSTEDRVSD